jgi:hypothetical protein
MVVAMVHEHVHQRTGQQECVRQEAQNMGTMLSEEQETPDDGDDQECNACARAPERRRVVVNGVHNVVP